MLDVEGMKGGECGRGKGGRLSMKEGGRGDEKKVIFVVICISYL